MMMMMMMAMMTRKPKRNSLERETRELQSELKKTERAAEKARDEAGKTERRDRFSQANTEWGIPEATASCIIGSDEEEKEIVKNRTDHEHRRTR